MTDREDLDPFWKIALMWGLVHFLCLLVLKLFIFLLGHLPLGSTALDPVILLLDWVQSVLVAPRHFLRWLWPSEYTPGFLNLLTQIGCSVIWGVGLTWILRAWRRMQSR